MPRDPEWSGPLAADGYIPITPDIDKLLGYPGNRLFFSPRSTADVTCTLKQY